MQNVARVPFPPAFFRLHVGVAPVLTSLAGISFAVSFSYPFLWPVGWTSLAILYVSLLAVPSVRAAFLLGALFGLAAFGTGTSWVYLALAKSASTFILPPGFSTAIFLFYLALFPATACALTRYAWNRSGSAWMESMIFASAWAAIEMLRGKLFGGFTILSAGYLQIEGPLHGLAPVVGMYGLSWLMAWLAALAVQACCQPARRFLKLALIAALCAGSAGGDLIEWTSPSGNPVKVRLLQPDLDVTEKQATEKRSEILDQLFAEVIAKPADIILTPESVIPHFWHELPTNYIERLHAFARNSKSNILLNVVTVEGERGAVNNMLGILAENNNIFPRYEKFHLMPFGEYFPIGMSWFSKAMHPQELTAGSWRQDAMPIAGQRLGFMVCYEEMFGGEVIRWIPNASILVNPGNLSWVTGTLAASQLLDIARMRALETGRPVLRAPNNGYTAIIDHQGKVSAILPMSVSGALHGSVQGRQGNTPYSRWGDSVLIVLITFTFLVWGARRLHIINS